MQKELQREDFLHEVNESMEPKKEVLSEIRRRKRKAFGEHSMENVSYKSLLELHLRQCKIKSLSDTTIDGYKYAARYFLDFAGYDLMCADVTQDLINEYYLYLQNFHKATTINSYVFKICPTIRYGMEQGYIREKIEFTHLVEQQEIKEIYTKEELEKLLKRPSGDSFTEFRAWVIINTFLATGIRAGELRALKVKDVNLQDDYITLNKTKSREARILPIPTSLHLALEEWLRVRSGAKEEYLFCNIYGEMLKRTALQKAIKRYSNSRGVDKSGLHLYRHTFITLSVRKGVSPIMLKRITGHKTMRMLEHYYAFNPTDLVNIIDEFNPLEEFKPKEKKF